MTRGTALFLAAVLIPGVHDVLDLSRYLSRRVGADENGMWVADRLLITPGYRLRCWGLGGHVDHAGDDTTAEYTTRVALQLGPLSLAVDYLGTPATEPTAPDLPQLVPAPETASRRQIA